MDHTEQHDPERFDTANETPPEGNRGLLTMTDYTNTVERLARKHERTAIHATLIRLYAQPIPTERPKGNELQEARFRAGYLRAMRAVFEELGFSFTAKGEKNEQQL